MSEDEGDEYLAWNCMTKEEWEDTYERTCNQV